MGYEMYTMLQGIADVERARGGDLNVRQEFNAGVAANEGTWDIKTTISTNKANAVAYLNFYDYDGSINQIPEKYNKFTSLELIGEVKTISDNPQNVLNTVASIKKGYEQAIDNAKKNPSSGYDI